MVVGAVAVRRERGQPADTTRSLDWFHVAWSGTARTDDADAARACILTYHDDADGRSGYLAVLSRRRTSVRQLDIMN